MTGRNSTKDGTMHLLASLRIRVSIVMLTTVVYAVSAALADAVYGSMYTRPPGFWYMLSAFPVFGMLLADLAACWAIYRLRFATLEVGSMLVLLAVLAAIRLSLAIPMSGHALLLAYFIVRRVLVRLPPNRLHWVELGIAAVLYIVIIYLKVFCLDDLLTPATGTGAGLALAVVSWVLLRWRGAVTDPASPVSRSP